MSSKSSTSSPGSSGSGRKWQNQNHEAKEVAKLENGGSDQDNCLLMTKLIITDGDVSHILSLTTTDFPHKSEWSEQHLPEILFYILTPPSDYEGLKVQILKDEDGHDVLSDEGHPVKDFEILPKRISLDVPGKLPFFRFEPTNHPQGGLSRHGDALIAASAIGTSSIDRSLILRVA